MALGALIKQVHAHRQSQDFLFEGGKPQIACNDVITNFRKRNFLWTRISENERLETLAWFGT